MQYFRREDTIFRREDILFRLGDTSFPRKGRTYLMILNIFPIIVFVPEQLHINDWELLGTAFSVDL